jgi:hypothetical protein
MGQSPTVSASPLSVLGYLLVGAEPAAEPSVV